MIASVINMAIMAVLQEIIFDVVPISFSSKVSFKQFVVLFRFSAYEFEPVSKGHYYYNYDSLNNTLTIEYFVVVVVFALCDTVKPPNSDQ